MRRLKAGTAGVAVAALALTLAACGSDSDDSDSNTDNSESSGSTDLSAELTWWDTSDPANEGPAFKELIKKFNEEYPDVTINYQSVDFGSAQNDFKTAAKAGKGAPDILRAEVAWVPEFASLGYLYALDDTELLDNNFLETPLSSNVYDGKTYGVPQVTDTLGLMYNKALFEKAGLDPRVRVARLPLRPGRHRRTREQLPRDPALQQRLRRQDLRRPAGHRHPRADVQQEALRGGRHRRGPHHVGRGQDRVRGAEVQGEGGRHLRQRRRLLHAPLHLRRGR